MRPFADEQTIHGSLCGDGADSWHAEILLRSLNGGIICGVTFTPTHVFARNKLNLTLCCFGADNAYNTLITLPEAELNCFIGGLVSSGIAPQMTGSGNSTQLARVKYWMDLYTRHGTATESTIGVLHYPDGVVFPSSD